MKISLFNAFEQFKGVHNVNQSSENSNKFSFSGLKMSSPLNQDIVSFSSINTPKISTMKEAYEHYQKVAQDVNKSLKDGDELSAFEMLGYDVESNFETDKITINGDYKSFFDVKTKHETLRISYEQAGINQEELLKNVEKIKGKAVFPDKFKPDHFIEVDKLDNTHFPYKLEDLARKFTMLNPEFQKNVNLIKKLSEKGDSYNALRIMGYDVEKDENGAIKVNGDLDFTYSFQYADRKPKFSAWYLGIDSNKLMKNVHKINGSLYVDYQITKLDKNLEVTGKVVTERIGNNSYLFENFLTVNDVASQYQHKKITPEIIASLLRTGALTPSLKTAQTGYFSGVTGKNKELLDNVANNRDTILTVHEMEAKFGKHGKTLTNAFKQGKLIPYGADDNFVAGKNDDYRDFIYDISDKRNKKTLNYIKQLEQKLIQQVGKNKIISLLGNTVKTTPKNFPLREYPLKALTEEYGYGSKADLMASCDLLKNSFELKQYILNNDVYNLLTPEMSQILEITRHKNPAMLKVSDLANAIENMKDFNHKLGYSKLNVIDQTPYKKIAHLSDYYINLEDKNNREILSSIGNPEFKKWFKERLAASEEYKAENIRKMEKFKEMKTLPTEQELEEIETKRQEDFKKLRYEMRQQEIERKEAVSKRKSLTLTIAWALSKNTRNVMEINANVHPHIKPILKKNIELQKIKSSLFAHEMSYEEMTDKINELKLSREEKIELLSYYKECWRIAGTEEYIQALQDAAVIAQDYLIYGIDAIEDKEVKDKVLKWEKTHNKD